MESPQAVTYLTPAGAAVNDPTGQVVPLDALAECINPFDIRLDSIEVISHGVRSWGGGTIAQTYHRTLGPQLLGGASGDVEVHVLLELPRRPHGPGVVSAVSGVEHHVGAVDGLPVDHGDVGARGAHLPAVVVAAGHREDEPGGGPDRHRSARRGT